MNTYPLPLHIKPEVALLKDGADTLQDVELLTLLCRSVYTQNDAHDVAAHILAEKPLKSLWTLSMQELATIDGMGIGLASVIVAARTLWQRASVANPPVSVTTAAEVAAMMGYLSSYSQEHLIGLYFNTRHHVIDQRTLSIGMVNSSLLDMREIFAPAITLKAVSVILVHNHPSGDPRPSPEDTNATRAVVAAGRLLDITLIDHLIIAKDGWTSMRKEYSGFFQEE